MLRNYIQLTQEEQQSNKRITKYISENVKNLKTPFLKQQKINSKMSIIVLKLKMVNDLIIKKKKENENDLPKKSDPNINEKFFFLKL